MTAIGRESGPDRVVPARLCERCEENQALEGKPYCAQCADELNEELAQPSQQPETEAE